MCEGDELVSVNGSACDVFWPKRMIVVAVTFQSFISKSVACFVTPFSGNKVFAGPLHFRDARR